MHYLSTYCLLSGALGVDVLIERVPPAAVLLQVACTYALLEHIMYVYHFLFVYRAKYRR